METNDYIQKIDAVLDDMQRIAEKHELSYWNGTGMGWIQNIPVRQFVELCDHYGIKPGLAGDDTAWPKRGNVCLAIVCERVLPAASDPLEKLRRIATQTSAAA